MPPKPAWAPRESWAFQDPGMLSCCNLDWEPPIVSTCGLLQILYLIFISCLFNYLSEIPADPIPEFPVAFCQDLFVLLLQTAWPFSVFLDACIRWEQNHGKCSAWAAKTYADLAAYLVNRFISSHLPSPNTRPHFGLFSHFIAQVVEKDNVTRIGGVHNNDSPHNVRSHIGSFLSWIMIDVVLTWQMDTWHKNERPVCTKPSSAYLPANDKQSCQYLTGHLSTDPTVMSEYFDIFVSF